MMDQAAMYMAAGAMGLASARNKAAKMLRDMLDSIGANVGSRDPPLEAAAVESAGDGGSDELEDFGDTLVIE